MPWKKPVPDPPHLQHPSDYYLIKQDLSSTDALRHTLQLIAGIETTLDEYICSNAGEAGVPMLVNTAHQLQMVKALTQFVLQRFEQTPQALYEIRRRRHRMVQASETIAA